MGQVINYSIMAFQAARGPGPRKTYGKISSSPYYLFYSHRTHIGLQ